LLPTECALLERYRKLPESARCLSVRLANRRRTVFRYSRLQYREIPALATAIETLADAGLVATDPVQLLGNKLSWLDEFTQAELIELFGHGLESCPLSKAELLKTIPQTLPVFANSISDPAPAAYSTHPQRLSTASSLLTLNGLTR